MSPLHRDISVAALLSELFLTLQMAFHTGAVRGGVVLDLKSNSNF